MENCTPLLLVLAEKLNKEPGKVLPIVTGTRGAIPKKTLSSLAELDITDTGSYMTIALLALRNSIEIYNFMDYDKPQHPACPVDLTWALVSTFLNHVYVRPTFYHFNLF
jgi:hypothetical protein